MPNSNEQQSSSDDLIAELARLMAEEAQSDRPATASKPAPKPDPDQRTPEGATVVRIPAARPAQSVQTPTGSAWGRVEEAPSPANSDQKPDPAPVRTDRAAPDAPFAPATEAASREAGGGENEAFLSALSAPTAGQDEAAAAKAPVQFPAAPPPRADAAPLEQPESAAPTDHNPDNDPIAELIAEQEREEAQRTARVAIPRHVFPDQAAKVRPGAAPAQTAAPQPAPEAKAGPAAGQGAESRADVLSMLRSMNAAMSPPPAAARPGSQSGDAFATPVFGSETARPAPAPAAVDPLDEIESLIGDAVKLSRDDQRLTRGGPEPEADLDDAAHAAEAAIAAAAAASGRTTRQAPRSDSPLDKAPETAGIASEIDRSEIKPAKPHNNRLIIGAAAAATILVAVALGLYWMFGETGAPDSAVPFLASNTNDAKAPVEPNATSADTSQPTIFNELDGTGNQPPADEQIVSRDQSTNVVGTDATAANTTAADTAVAAAAATGAGVAGTVNADAGTAAPIRQVESPESADEGLANRKVRTVTVRPDGTIVSSEDTLAANEVLPVARPNVPTLSGDMTAPGDFQVTTAPAGTDAATAGSAPATTVATAETPAGTAANGAAADPLASLISGSVAEGDAAAGMDTAAPTGERVVNAPYPVQRPSDAALRTALAAVAATMATTTGGQAATGNTGNTIDLIANSANQAAAQLPAATSPTTTQQTRPAATTTATAATTPAVTAPAGQDAPAYVQLSSQRSVDAANATLTSIDQRFHGLFNGAKPFVKQVDLGDRGIYYRVLVPANSLADATGVCASVKSAGGDCFVRTN